MFKSRPENYPPVPSLEELAYWREQELGEKAAASRRRGSGKIKLDPWRGELAKLLERSNLPVPEIHKLLVGQGTEVNVKTLFKYLREHMPVEYEAYLERMGTGKGGRPKKTAPPEQVSAPTVEEPKNRQQEIDTAQEQRAEIKKANNLADLLSISRGGVDTADYE